IADPNAGPPNALEQIRAAGVRVEIVPGGPSPDSVVAQILAIGRLVGREPQARALADSLQAQLRRAEALIDTTQRPRVLFVQAQAPGVTGLAGHGTNADAFIRLAGGENVMASTEGYKPMTPESVADAAPDVIVLTERTLGQAGGLDTFLGQPGVAQTAAARARQVVVVPDAAMNFGPSLGQAVLNLAARLRGITGGAAPPAR
ncbi:MAG TPA: ABC transporter substrate-binding protein, partial [Rhodothermales bacterium]|nr:ABC transporter substrate-binding protein [Rhodothermales bacterium]